MNFFTKCSVLDHHISELLVISVDTASFLNQERMSNVIGSNVILPCHASDGGPVRWHHESNITPQDVIFDGRSVQPKYIDKISIHPTAGDFNLSISNVQPNDYGWYICIGSNSQHVLPYFLEVHGLYCFRPADVLNEDIFYFVE